MKPMNFMKAKGLLTQFTTNHPKLPAFFKAASSQIGDMKVRPEDMQLVEELKNLSK